MADNEAEDGEKAEKAARAAKARPKAEPGQRAAKGKAAKEWRRAEKKPREPEETVTPRLRTHFDQIDPQGADRAVRLQESDAGAAGRQDRAQHGHRRGRRRPQEGRAGGRRLSAIAGQKPVITKSRKSIATYKLRDGQAIGCKVTLRKARMYEFLDRLVNIALPRVRDFRGLNPKSFDGRGNYLARHQGAHHFPGDRLRQGPGYVGHGHHGLHHRA